jgi:hypothetical protein
MNTGETPFVGGWPVLVTPVILLALKRSACLKPGEVPATAGQPVLASAVFLAHGLVLASRWMLSEALIVAG